ncbi:MULTISPECIES: MgtC/SapB family protein [unclassified Streptococcus]|uniref:MgtC/SapB family protein n=1 Tax=unclassified Streptococcus TaxID=2608887 RepID=UPI000AFBC8B8|nr:MULTISPECIES: MgtC/SapB family protein [unclassified Streptococcus]
MLDTIALLIEVRHIILILLSCFSDFIIGYERKCKHKRAGRKTHILVVLTANLMMILSKEAFLDTPNDDTSRVAVQIVSGIIFMRDKKSVLSPQ